MDSIYNALIAESRIINKDFVVESIWADGYITSLRYFHQDNRIKICGSDREFNTLNELESYYLGRIKEFRNAQFLKGYRAKTN